MLRLYAILNELLRVYSTMAIDLKDLKFKVFEGKNCFWFYIFTDKILSVIKKVIWKLLYISECSELERCKPASNKNFILIETWCYIYYYYSIMKLLNLAFRFL